MKGLFDDQKSSLVGSLSITAESLRSYGGQHRHWCVAFSGGKGSTATVAAVAYLIEPGIVPRPESLTAIYADTRLELPNLQAAAMGMFEEHFKDGTVQKALFGMEGQE